MFFALMTMPSIVPVMASVSVSNLPPAMMSGRPTAAPCTSCRHYFSPSSRRMPSIIGCQPNTSETMKASMRMSVGLLSLTVDL